MSHFIGDDCPGGHLDLLETAVDTGRRAQAAVDQVIADHAAATAQAEFDLLYDEGPVLGGERGPAADLVVVDDPVAQRDRAVAAERGAFDERLAADHGVPAVIRSREGGGQQQRSTLVRVDEPGEFYLHLVQDDGGRVVAAFTRSATFPDGDEL